MKIVLVSSESGNKLGEYEFPAVPRVGDHITFGEGGNLGPLPVEAVGFRVRSADDPAQIEVVVGNKR